MHNVISLSIFIEKPQNQKARIFRQGKNIINKKKIIKLEVLKRWQSDYKTKKQPDYVLTPKS